MFKNRIFQADLEEYKYLQMALDYFDAKYYETTGLDVQEEYFEKTLQIQTRMLALELKWGHLLDRHVLN